MLRDYRPEDSTDLNRVALAAFRQFQAAYADWPAMALRVSQMSKLSETAEVIVAIKDAALVGGVAYVPARASKAPYFDPDWPIIRMLVVDPVARGHGIGRALTEDCVARARRDGASLIALHTTPIMNVALPMYLRMGFQRVRDAPPIYGVPYAVYGLRLT